MKKCILVKRRMKKVVADITYKVKEMIQRIYNFPKEITIKEAVVYQDYDNSYWVVITYIMDDVEYQNKQRVSFDLTETIRDILFGIADFYERMHVIK